MLPRRCQNNGGGNVLHKTISNEPFVFNGFDNVTNDNSVIWEACKKELPNIMKNELTDKQRLCVMGVFYEGLNQVQVAKKLHLSQPTVSRHLERAMTILLNRLTYAMSVTRRGVRLSLMNHTKSKPVQPSNHRNTSTLLLSARVKYL